MIRQAGEQDSSLVPTGIADSSTWQGVAEVGGYGEMPHRAIEYGENDSWGNNPRRNGQVDMRP